MFQSENRGQLNYAGDCESANEFKYGLYSNAGVNGVNYEQAGELAISGGVTELQIGDEVDYVDQYEYEYDY
ncbi:MAG: hypothetical protein EZS28_007112, partial [Streblomastix strix]